MRGAKFCVFGDFFMINKNKTVKLNSNIKYEHRLKLYRNSNWQEKDRMSINRKVIAISQILKFRHNSQKFAPEKSIIYMVNI